MGVGRGAGEGGGLGDGYVMFSRLMNAVDIE